ncbi:hypothetical protein [Schlesneria paludicola]|uniref:hypothetical protein n=1 Tax=Schlesneria paludicola TaxID=360056 RepID=UPI000299EDB1|nr:hypothetical protein [Schlesneria paludicola]
MARRHASKQDSLELLLDTICNTFGGVLFIAILVVLLLQQTGASPVSTTPDQIPVSADEFAKTTERFESAVEELARRRLNRDAQNLLVQDFAPESHRQLLVTRAELTARQDALQRDVDQQLIANTEAVIDVETLEQETKTIEAKLAESQERLAAAEAKLAAEQQSRVHETKMPVMHAAKNKIEIALILNYGRLYVWHKYDGLERTGLNLDDFVVVGAEFDWLVTQPNPLAGIPLDDSKLSKEAVRRALKPFPPGRCTLCFVVRPDSFEEFRYARDRAIEMGFEYRIFPTREGDPISDSGQGRDQVQ